MYVRHSIKKAEFRQFNYTLKPEIGLLDPFIVD